MMRVSSARHRTRTELGLEWPPLSGTVLGARISSAGILLKKPPGTKAERKRTDFVQRQTRIHTWASNGHFWTLMVGGKA